MRPRGDKGKLTRILFVASRPQRLNFKIVTPLPIAHFDSFSFRMYIFYHGYTGILTKLIASNVVFPFSLTKHNFALILTATENGSLIDIYDTKIALLLWVSQKASAF